MDKDLSKNLSFFREKNNLDEVIKILLNEKKKNPKNLDILFQLGGAYRSLGNFKEALSNYEEILLYDEAYTAAYRMIGTIINHNQTGKYLEKLEKLKVNNNLQSEQKIDLYFALGKAYEDLNENEKSANYYILANKTKKEITKYNFKIHEEHFDQIFETFKNVNFDDRKFNIKNNKKIIFICGLPRTGSTLFENIIASHKEVYSGGELPYLQRSVKKYFAENDKLIKDKILSHLNDKNMDFFNDYLKSLLNHNFTEKNITDKQLENFRWIGLIKLFFPNSKIILSKRNYKSNAVSIYKNNFNSGYNNWTNDPKDILNYIKHYKKFINFWKKNFPNELFEIEYEELVKKKDTVIKEIINFCELDWDPNCLIFYKNKSPIKTASAFQARQPIYETSVKTDTVLFNNIFLDQDFIDI
jgi:tetratricopeptide (TPR) repeat protein